MLWKGHPKVVLEGVIQLPTNSCSTFLHVPGDQVVHKGPGCGMEGVATAYGSISCSMASCVLTAEWPPVMYGVSADNCIYSPVFSYIAVCFLLQNPVCFTITLVWAGIELNFFMVASMRLCFAFVLEIVLMTEGCFGYCWAVLTQR